MLLLALSRGAAGNHHNDFRCSTFLGRTFGTVSTSASSDLLKAIDRIVM